MFSNNRKFLKTGSIGLKTVFGLILVLVTVVSAVAADGNLPGGTAISVEITSPMDGASIPETDPSIMVDGTAAIGEGVPQADTTLVYVMDVSGSTQALDGCGGDINGDGRVNSRLDCEIASLIALNDNAIILGIVGEVGVAAFSGTTPPEAAAGDVNPASGIQLLTGPDTDDNSNGINDIDEVIFSATAGPSPSGFPNYGLHSFTALMAGSGGTNYAAGIEAALAILDTSSLDNKLVIFTSDGFNLLGTNVSSLQADVVSSGAVFYTFAVGNAADISCTEDPSGLGSLLDVAQLSEPDGQCFQVGSIDDLPDVLPEVLVSTLTSLELAVDGGAATDISGDATPAPPLDGPDSLTYNTSIPNLSVGVHQICVTAKGNDVGGDGEVTDCVEVIINAAPTVDAGGPSYSGDEGSPIPLTGTASDSDGPALSTSWSYTGPASCTFSDPNSLTSDITCEDNGDYTVMLTADDGLNEPTVANAMVTVYNVAPTVDAGPDQFVSVGETVNLSGTFTDPAKKADEPYAWNWDLDGTPSAAGEGTSSSIPFPFTGEFFVMLPIIRAQPGAGTVSDNAVDISGTVNYGDPIPASTSFAAPGTYVLTLTVTDKDGGTGSDSLMVTVNAPPDCSPAFPTPDTLWPPNHFLEPVTVLGVTDPDGDPVTITIDSIFQDEPTNGLGDGDTSPDGFGIGTDTALVRAERSGTSNGRVYHIGFTASDPYGASCSGVVQVTVNKSMSEKHKAVDEGPLYDSTLP